MKIFYYDNFKELMKTNTAEDNPETNGEEETCIINLLQKKQVKGKKTSLLHKGGLY